MDVLGLGFAGPAVAGVAFRLHRHVHPGGLDDAQHARLTAAARAGGADALALAEDETPGDPGIGHDLVPHQHGAAFPVPERRTVGTRAGARSGNRRGVRLQVSVAVAVRAVLAVSLAAVAECPGVAL